MYLTGFADEAAADIDGQIRATKELGWSRIEMRNVDGVNLHDLPDDKFEEVYGKCLGEVLSSEEIVAGYSMDFHDVVEELKDRNVESTAAEVEHKASFVSRAVSYAVGNSSGCRLVYDPADLKACKLSSFLCGFSLKVVEVGRHRYYGLFDLAAEEVFGILL